MELRGWEVKSLRAGQAQLQDSHVIVKDGEAFLMGSKMVPLANANRHPPPDSTRTRKLLLHHAELSKLNGAVRRKGNTIVATAMYWKNGHAKLEIALAVGKKTYDKRAEIRDAEWNRQKQRAIRTTSKQRH